MASRLPPPSEYTSKLTGSLNDLRKEHQLCDIIINVGGKAFHAHKNILAACSSYFFAMFTSGFREATESEVNIDGKSEIFELLLEYVYTGKMQIAGETAYDLLQMACYMQFTHIIQYCSKFIQIEYELSSKTDAKIPMGFVYKIYELASFHKLKVLAQKSEKHMSNYFRKLKSSDVFLQEASVEFMKKFLRRSDLARRDEEKEVLELAVKWLKHDWESRRNFAASLLNKVRLGLVSDQNLTDLLDAEILKIRKCKRLLQVTRKAQRSKDSAHNLSKMFPQIFAPRKRSIRAPIAISAPEEESTSCSSFYYYSIKQKQWCEIPSIPALKRLPTFIVIDDTLYAIGGEEEEVIEEEPEPSWWPSMMPLPHQLDPDHEVEYESEETNEFQQYDAEHNCWVSLPSLNRYCSKEAFVVHLNGCIYMFAKSSRHCEYFDIAGNKWNDISGLPGKDSLECCSFVIAYRDRILLYGISGSYNTNGRYTKTETILVYNPSKREWKSKLTKPNETKRNSTKPVLFVHGDRCYRIAFCDIPNAGDNWYFSDTVQQKPTVNMLEVYSSDSTKFKSTFTIGEEIKQEFIPANSIGAFRIGDEVFITKDGTVHQTTLKINEDQATDIQLSKWKNFFDLERRSNIVNFTFDWKNSSGE